MNAKQLFAAATFALIGASAFAAEATSFPIEAGALTRAEVKAELVRAQQAGEVVVADESYGSFPASSVAARKAGFANPVAQGRDDVRAASRATKFNELYVGG
jgi:hypothetical protein